MPGRRLGAYAPLREATRKRMTMHARAVGALLAALAVLAASGCAALRSKTPAGEAPAIELGDYAKGVEADVLAAFAKTASARFAKGEPLAAALKDLAANKFDCAASIQKGGEPPAQVCRRVIKADDCTNTWQVHLFAGGAEKDVVERARGLYDKTCGKEELLGG